MKPFLVLLLLSPVHSAHLLFQHNESIAATVTLAANGDLEVNSAPGQRVLINGVDILGMLATHAEQLATFSSSKSCHEIISADASAASGSYDIQFGRHIVRTQCDFTGGFAWTLVGKVSGYHDMGTTWLVSKQNEGYLASWPGIESGTYSSVDSRQLAVDSTHFRFASSDASKWVYWPLASGRTVSTIWNRGSGNTASEWANTDTISSDAVDQGNSEAVSAVAWDGGSNTCYVNKYGVMPLNGHGGSYPAALYNDRGNTAPNEYCYSVCVTTSSHNGCDAPDSDSDWPNTDYTSAPFVSVWLGTAYG